jgi:hypothetical protein
MNTKSSASLRALHKAGRSNPVKNLESTNPEEGEALQIQLSTLLRICLKLTTGLLRPALCRARNDDRGLNINILAYERGR